MDTIPLITLSSDFGVQSQGIGAMKAAIFEIAPHTRVIDLMHGLPAFDITAAARTLETLDTFPVGTHVCVCDPGVGSDRKVVAIEVARGDVFVGPDNGVFLPATRILGGIKRVVEVSNRDFMRSDISHIFHGRDIFSPVAAHLSNGVDIATLGTDLEIERLVVAPYEEARVEGGKVCSAIIQINRFGSAHLNIRHAQWDELGFELGSTIQAEFLAHVAPGKDPRVLTVELTVGQTFSDVPVGGKVILKDDYGRVEIAKNLGRFDEEVSVSIGDRVEFPLPR